MKTYSKLEALNTDCDQWIKKSEADEMKQKIVVALMDMELEDEVFQKLINVIQR